MEDKIRGIGNGRVIIHQDFVRLKTELEEAHTQIAGLQKKQIGHDDEVVLAHVRISTLEMIVEDIQNGSQEDINICSTSHDLGRHLEIREAAIARKCSYKEFMSYQPFNFKGTEGAPIEIEEAYKVTWSKFKKLLIKKYCLQTEVKKMEDEFYNLTVKGKDLKTYVRRFQELGILCPAMVPNSEKMMEFSSGDYPEVLKEMLPLQSLKLWRKPLP
uniref:Reverse transcriptase domain-containing protein n=1 Tax=Tanacetum cinerariifolium TaxID=118510 RepID=A0A6L2P5E3_TANCI|nr:reverse transcriptase domain-containing protein [Tanacetum cinerariifolium]